MSLQLGKAQDCPASLQLSQQLQLSRRATGSIEFTICGSAEEVSMGQAG